MKAELDLVDDADLVAMILAERQDVADAALHALSPATLKAYANEVLRFERWCAMRGFCAMPAESINVAAYTVWLAKQGSPFSRALVAIGRAHVDAGLPNPCKHPDMLAVRVGAAKKFGRTVTGAETITADMLKRMADHRRTSPLHRTYLLLTWAAALRNDESCSLRRGDIKIVRQGAEVFVERSKTDQERKGEVVPVPYAESRFCPVEALIEHLADTPGEPHDLLWGFSARNGFKVVRSAGKRVGYTDLSPHGLRGGFATEAAASGASNRQIKRTTRHKSDRVLEGYINAGVRWHDSVPSLL